MNSYTNAYDKLFNNMKNTFTVVNDGCECTLGEYMLKRAKEKKNTASSNLPVAMYGKDTAVTAIYSYISDKLTIKTPPVKDKTIKAFPFRSCAAAMLCAVVSCAAVFSYGNLLISEGDNSAYVAEVECENDEAYDVLTTDAAQNK